MLTGGFLIFYLTYIRSFNVIIVNRVWYIHNYARYSGILLSSSSLNRDALWTRSTLSRLEIPDILDDQVYIYCTTVVQSRL